MEIQSSESRELEKQDKFASKKNKTSEMIDKNIIGVLKRHELDVRDIDISPSGDYFITCSEHSQGEIPKVIVWNVSELIEGENEPEIILEGKQKDNIDLQINNWFLCVESTVAKINAEDWWIIAAGSIIGEIYIWCGKIDPINKEWIFKEYGLTIIEEENERLRRFPKATYDLKIFKNSEKDKSYDIYFTSNNVQTINISDTKDNTINKTTITMDSNGNIKKEETIVLGTLNQWITSMDIHREKNFLVVGTRDGKILKWDLKKSANTSILIGEHEDSVSCVKVFTDGSKIASGCLDNSIRIWKNNDTNKPDIDYEFIGHSESVFSCDIQKDDKFLMSTSQDNTIKIWDLEKGNWIRSIDIGDFQDAYETDTKSKMYLKRIRITPDNRFIFIAMDNTILILKNFGFVWQFGEQLKFIEKVDKNLYTKIYGENLLQIAYNSPENEDTIKKLYNLVKKRIIKATKVDLSLKSQELKSTIGGLKGQELGTLFVPSFIELETETKFQKEYIIGVKETYSTYWHGIKNSNFKLPDLPWQFKLYITTDDEEEIMDARFTEITNPNIKDSAYIIMKDRGQTLIRFLMVLENVPTAFIPLIKNINLDIEDDRGDHENLVFSDFTFSNNFIKILKNPRKSVEKFETLKKPERIFYNFCTFQLEGGYSTEKFANIFVRNITIEFTEDLNPLETITSVNEDTEIFLAFKNNFQFPLIPKTQIQIGKGIASTVGKIVDEYFAKIIIVEFIFSFWGYLMAAILALFPDEASLTESELEIIKLISLLSNIVTISGIVIIIIVLLMLFIKKK